MNFLDVVLLIGGICSIGHFVWTMKQVFECKRNETFYDLSLSWEIKLYLVLLLACYIGIVNFIDTGILKQGFMAITLAVAYAIVPISRQQRLSNFVSSFFCYFIIFHYFGSGI